MRQGVIGLTTTTHNDVFQVRRAADRWALNHGFDGVEQVPAEMRVGLAEALVAENRDLDPKAVRAALLELMSQQTEALREATAVTDSGGEATLRTNSPPIWDSRGRGARGPAGLLMSLFGRPAPDGDPLAERRQEGTTFPDLDEGKFVQEMQQSLTAGFDIPGTVQQGPTCGLQLLVSIFDAIQARRPDSPELLNPLVRLEDAEREGSHTQALDTKESLLEVARARGYTQDGEIFTARDMVSLAEYFGYRAKLHTNATLADAQGALGREASVMIAIDVDRDGNPGLFNGARAHWVAIEGTFEKDGVDYIVGTHTWSGAEYIWAADQVFESSRQLSCADRELFPNAPQDLRKTLAGRMVVVAA